MNENTAALDLVGKRAHKAVDGCHGRRFDCAFRVTIILGEHGELPAASIDHRGQDSARVMQRGGQVNLKRHVDAGFRKLQKAGLLKPAKCHMDEDVRLQSFCNGADIFSIRQIHCQRHDPVLDAHLVKRDAIVPERMHLRPFFCKRGHDRAFGSMRRPVTSAFVITRSP